MFVFHFLVQHNVFYPVAIASIFSLFENRDKKLQYLDQNASNYEMYVTLVAVGGQ